MLLAFTSSHNMDTKTNLQFRSCMLSRPNMVLTVLFRTEHDEQGNSNSHDWKKEGMLNRWLVVCCNYIIDRLQFPVHVGFVVEKVSLG